MVGIIDEYFLLDGQVFWHGACNMYGTNERMDVMEINTGGCWGDLNATGLTTRAGTH